MEAIQRAPTVNDLRVKMCYICCEEEAYDKPTQPPRRWVHPCKCTLVAHETCLLEWIRASENNPDKLTSNILKCPQCGERYELVSRNPLMLQFMDNVNALLSCSGLTVTVLSAGALVSSVGVGVYILFTSYGVLALHSFIGNEMARLVLGDDIDQWPYHAFVNLPMIPLSLVLSRTKRYRDVIPFLHLMMLWPSVPPVARQQLGGGGVLSFFGFASAGGRGLPRIRQPAIPHVIVEETVRDIFNSWPPSPLIFSFIVRIVRERYSVYINRFRRFVLGDKLDDDEGEMHRGGLGRVIAENFRMEMRIENGEVQAEAHGQEGQQAGALPANNQADQIRDDNNVRLELDAPEDAPQPAQEVELLNPPHAAAPAAGGLAGRARIPPPPANPDPNEPRENGENAERARLRLRLTGGALGSLIGGALIVPPLAAFTGSILLRLALPSGPRAHERVNADLGSPYSPRRLLCRFLGVRPPNSAPLYSIWDMYAMPESMGTWERTSASIAVLARALFVGTPAWTGSDPVWWRNTVGLGLFCVAKDLLSIWYQYLSQREIRSRHLKDRSFDEIDPAELDLKPELRDAFRRTQV